MSKQQWHRTLTFMALFLALAWSATGIVPGTSQAQLEPVYVDYFPPPHRDEIQAVLRQAHRVRAQLAEPLSQCNQEQAPYRPKSQLSLQ